jgi:hypothetical protein
MVRSALCVYTASSVEEADIIAAWLAEQEIEAVVPDRFSIGAATWGQPAIVPGGIEICVVNPTDAEVAQSLLEQHAEALQEQLETRGDDGSPISVVCEACHETVSFANSEAGSVAECPNCREYIDVPGDDDDDLESEST